VRERERERERERDRETERQTDREQREQYLGRDIEKQSTENCRQETQKISRV
jgi:hypothetical protein